jgi:tryptophanyl-tRNA synthetase
MTKDFTVTPYAVEGTVDYEKLLDQFGADELTADQRDQFPDLMHPLVRRQIYYAGRDIDPFLDAVESGEQCSIVTGIGPSGPMHIGHIFPFYFAKELQDRTGAHVYIPLSDDEKYLAKDLSFREVQRWTEENLRDILAVGFDPERTRIIVDTEDSDVVYPAAAEFAKHYTQRTVNATTASPRTWDSRSIQPSRPRTCSYPNSSMGATGRSCRSQSTRTHTSDCAGTSLEKPSMTFQSPLRC